jgi:hypothetical protein
LSKKLIGVVVLTATIFVLASPAPAFAESHDSRDFDGDGWVDGLVDLRPSDIRNTKLIGGGLSHSGLEVTIPRGTFRGLGAFDRLPADANQAWYRYHIQLINFDARSSGKLPGLSGLYSETARGCKPSRPGSPGWSARGLFGAAGSKGAPDGEIPIGIYLYHLDQPGPCGEAIYWDDSSLQPGRWHCVEGYVKLNELGLHDGAVKGWLDGTERYSRDGLAFRRPGESGVAIREMWLDVYYGGKKPTGYQLNLMIDEVSVSTTGRVGCLDRSTNVVGAFESKNDSIASYQPETGAWLMNRSSGIGFSTEELATYQTGDDWSTHLVGDFSGNGRDDIASYHPSNGTWWVSHVGETGLTTTRWATFSTNTGWGNHLAGDFTGDGQNDIASYHLANGTWWVSEPTRLTNQSDKVARVEWASQIRVRDSVGTASVDQILEELSAFSVPTNDTFTTGRWDAFSTTRGWSDQLAGDFNADGKDDIASYHPASGSWWVSLSDGERFTNSMWKRFNTTTGWTNHIAGDFNGDGRDDLASYHSATGTWWVSLSDGDRFTTTLWDAFSTSRGWSTQVAGDFNGDGKDDIASYHPTVGSWWVSLSDGSRFTTTRWDTFSTTTSWTSQIVGDFDGDGRDDIANYHAGNGTWWVSRSTGTDFITRKWAGS